MTLENLGSSRLLFLLGILVASAGIAQPPPAETCGPDASLDGGNTLPFLGVAFASVDDIDLSSSTGCFELGSDHVTCFVPTNNCLVDASCFGGLNLGEAPDGLQFSINAVAGPCSTSPSGCVDADQATGGGLINGLSLTAGTNYCFVCEVGNPGTVTLDIAPQQGEDCGALPVQLQSLGVE
ncbi:MAG: hypothetical protein K8J08_01970 [Thermoanaerobaculia bacterium]|nr:hypothetical protein [Thermoanaerobaculia bacterium]